MLVFSDEFETAGRNFSSGGDPHWQALNLHFLADSHPEVFKPQAVTTVGGKAVLTLSHASGSSGRLRRGRGGGEGRGGEAGRDGENTGGGGERGAGARAGAGGGGIAATHSLPPPPRLLADLLQASLPRCGVMQRKWGWGWVRGWVRGG